MIGFGLIWQQSHKNNLMSTTWSSVFVGVVFMNMMTFTYLFKVEKFKWHNFIDTHKAKQQAKNNLDPQ